MSHSILKTHADGIHKEKHLTDSVTNFIKNYIITMRPYLLFVSGITGIAGLSLGEGLSASS